MWSRQSILAADSARAAAAQSSTPAGANSFAALVAEDLHANTSRRGLRGGLSAFCSDPGFSTVLLHRVVCRLRAAGFGLLSRMVWRLNVTMSGCHIHPEATIGAALRLPHPTGIVIGVGARIGHCVTIYQNVTLGRGLRDVEYPVIEDEAIIFPNSVIAGAIVVGRRAVVGAGSVVIADVPPDSIVTGNPARVLRMRSQES